MNKNLVVLLVFVCGIACGIALNQFLGNADGPDDGAIIAVQPDSDAEETSRPNSDQPLSIALVNNVLPNTSPLWLLLELDTLRERGEEFSDLLNKEPVAKVLKDFVAALPQSVTPAIKAVIDHSDRASLFMMPPTDDSHIPAFVGAFRQSIEAATEARQVVREPLLAAFPDSSTKEETYGTVTVESIDAPFGTIAYGYDTGTLWVSNQQESFNRMFATPPPPEMMEKPGAHLELMNEYSDTAAALFLNASSEGPASVPYGMLPEFIASLGVERLACLYRLPDGQGQLTVIAPWKEAPAWVSNWEPIDAFPFNASDPAGLVELAFRWPAQVFSASSEGESDRFMGSGNRMFPMDPSMMGERGSRGRGSRGEDSNSGMMRERGNRGTRGEEGEGSRDSRSRGSSDDDSTGRNRSNRGDRSARGDSFRQRGEDGEGGRRSFGGMDGEDFRTRGSGRSNRFGGRRGETFQSMKWRMLSGMFPPGNVVGMNMYGFYDGSPVMTIAFPQYDPESSSLSRFERMPGLNKSEIEIAKIPGTLYQFGENPFSQMLGIERLISIERDETMYLFDVEEAARNFLGDVDTHPEGKTRRSKEIRDLLEKVRSPAQIEAVLSEDFFDQILDMEKARFAGDAAYEKEMEALFTEFNNRIEPMAISAGVGENGFFLETYTASNVGHALNSLILSLAAYRFLGN